MRRLLVDELPSSKKKSIPLNESEARHAVQVLRLRTGDTVEVLDGRGGHAQVKLHVAGEKVTVEWTEATGSSASLVPPDKQTVPCTLEIGILKGDAMEWVIEKAVELGIEAVQPIQTAHSVVQIRQKGADFFQSRWQKVADQSLKQCGRFTRLRVEPPLIFEDWLKSQEIRHQNSLSFSRLWFDEKNHENLPTLSQWIHSHLHASHAHEIPNLKLLIGPEGGWSEIERTSLIAHKGAPITRLSLGPLILRAETAAIYAISLTSAAFRD